MANRYWYNSGADAAWATLTGNWWDDLAHESQAAALPAPGDYVYLLGATAPADGPAAPLSLAGFDSTGCTGALASAVSANIVIAAAGELKIGLASGNAHVWTGDASAATTNILDVTAALNGSAKIGTNAEIHTSDLLVGANYIAGTVVIGNHATFAYSGEGQGSVWIRESPINITIGDDARFAGAWWISADTEGTLQIGDRCIFEGDAEQVIDADVTGIMRIGDDCIMRGLATIQYHKTAVQLFIGDRLTVEGACKLISDLADVGTITFGTGASPDTVAIIWRTSTPRFQLKMLTVNLGGHIDVYTDLAIDVGVHAGGIEMDQPQLVANGYKIRPRRSNVKVSFLDTWGDGVDLDFTRMYPRGG